MPHGKSKLDINKNDLQLLITQAVGQSTGYLINEIQDLRQEVIQLKECNDLLKKFVLDHNGEKVLKVLDRPNSAPSSKESAHGNRLRKLLSRPFTPHSTNSKDEKRALLSKEDQEKILKQKEDALQQLNELTKKEDEEAAKQKDGAKQKPVISKAKQVKQPKEDTKLKEGSKGGKQSREGSRQVKETVKLEDVQEGETIFQQDEFGGFSKERCGCKKSKTRKEDMCFKPEHERDRKKNKDEDKLTEMKEAKIIPFMEASGIFNQEDCSDLLEELSLLNNSYEAKEKYVFQPNGDLFDVPQLHEVETEEVKERIKELKESFAGSGVVAKTSPTIETKRTLKEDAFKIDLDQLSKETSTSFLGKIGACLSSMFRETKNDTIAAHSYTKEPQTHYNFPASNDKLNKNNSCQTSIANIPKRKRSKSRDSGHIKNTSAFKEPKARKEKEIVMSSSSVIAPRITIRDKLAQQSDSEPHCTKTPPQRKRAPTLSLRKFLRYSSRKDVEVQSSLGALFRGYAVEDEDTDDCELCASAAKIYKPKRKPLYRLCSHKAAQTIPNKIPTSRSRRREGVLEIKEVKDEDLTQVGVVEKRSMMDKPPPAIDAKQARNLEDSRNIEAARNLGDAQNTENAPNKPSCKTDTSKIFKEELCKRHISKRSERKSIKKASRDSLEYWLDCIGKDGVVTTAPNEGNEMFLFTIAKALARRSIGPLSDYND